eukprot:gnl/MRDRNA2_/MRDRNA2_145658_c0_seq1.p1 gnl/MRDRNA2_/MRDRNA2_145658_c0~~gnl/MRDRNA2_/MRDRNA2_145658_c0_seq1.p1  ORF type:complete len:323 (+),score=47.82 gnl/MRDRNA2_/MRDRNA2_145658_c0_seq1:53-1021(+)
MITRNMVSVIVLLAFAECVHAKELVAKSTAANDSRNELVDKLVNKLVDEALDGALQARHLHAQDLDNTALMLSIRGTPYGRSAFPYQSTFRSALVPRTKFPRHSVQMQAWSVPPEVVNAISQAIPWVTQAAAIYFAVRAVNFFMMPGGRTAPQDIRGTEALMAPKAHGTCPKPVQNDLKWGCDKETADRICAFNRHGAEYAGYFQASSFLREETGSKPVTFYDSVTGKPLFVAPVGRTWDEFVKESRVHGWPSFRDDEVVKDNVRVLADGETVSIDGTHLGHNLPDGSGNRYCINLVSIAGLPPKVIDLDSFQGPTRPYSKV